MYHLDLKNPSNSGTNQTTFSFTLECNCTKSSTKTNNSEIWLHLCNRFYTHLTMKGFVLPVNTCLSCSVTSLIVVEFCWREYLWLFSDLNKSHNKTASSWLLTFAFQLRSLIFLSAILNLLKRWMNEMFCYYFNEVIMHNSNIQIQSKHTINIRLTSR